MSKNMATLGYRSATIGDVIGTINILVEANRELSLALQRHSERLKLLEKPSSFISFVKKHCKREKRGICI